MKKIISLPMAALVLALAACGGGGGGGTVSTADNPLKKYAGTYYVCDRNEKNTLSLEATGSNSLNVTVSADVYSAANCTGSIIGSYRWNSAASMTYLGATTANLPAVTIFPTAGTLDKVTLTTTAMTATLTGSGVSGSCVRYSYVDNGVTSAGNTCYSLTTAATTATGALYLSSNDQYMVQFALSNTGVYAAQLIASRSPTFNLNTLIVR